MMGGTVETPPMKKDSKEEGKKRESRERGKKERKWERRARRERKKKRGRKASDYEKKKDLQCSSYHLGNNAERSHTYLPKLYDMQMSFWFVVKSRLRVLPQLVLSLSRRDISFKFIPSPLSHFTLV